MNGCGPAWMDKWPTTIKLKAFVAKHFLGWLFHASCNIHDEGYEEGGNWIRKIYCDVRFFAAMIKDAGGLDGLHKQIAALVVAFVYFILVLLAGWFSFNFD